MKRILTLVAILTVLAIPSALGAVPADSQALVSAPQANAVRISQVYGGGGNSGATYKNDFIELFNSGATAVSLSGWSVQYASATGSTWQVTNLNGSIGPGQYYLIQEAQGAGGTTNLPTPDATGSILMGAAAGKVALVSNTTALSGSCPTTGIVDFVGYGTTANCYEGNGPTPAPSNTTAVLRGNNGCTDTDNNSADFTAAAPNPRNSATAAYSCGDLPPSVSSTVPANGATGIALSVDLTINFSEPVTVTGSWFGITCTTSLAHTAAVTGGPTTYTLNPDVDFTFGESCSATVYAVQITDQDGAPDTMAGDYTWSFGVLGAAPACSTIPLIQESGNSSPCLGAVANIRGCITGVAADGFYMQAVGTDVDGSSATSDGIYVYRGSTWTNPSGWVPGNLVSVSGTIIEYYNTTEFQSGNSVTRLDAGTNCGGNGYPAPVTVVPNADPTANLMTLYERYEGMRVQMSFDGWVIGPIRRYASRFVYGDPELAFVDFGSTIPAYGRVFERDYPYYQGINYLSGSLNFDLPALDFGDEISGTSITGVLGYQFDKYSLLVDAPPTLTTVDRPDVTSNETTANTAAGEFDICFANVENFFDNCNDGMGDWGDWAPGYDVNPSLPAGSCETTVGPGIYQTKREKTANILVNKIKSCMVFGLEEMEGKQAVYNALAAQLALSDTAHTWTAAFVASGDTRNITQGFLWRNDVTLMGSVTPVSGAPYTSWVTDGVLEYRRIPPTGLFRFNAGTPKQVDIHLYAMHFKSKASSGSCTTPDCTDMREKEAADTRDILLHHQNAGEYAIGGGDFNDTLGSSPIAILDAVSPTLKSLYCDLGDRARYSYIFSGESEVLDHFYVTGNLLPANFGWAHTFNPVHVNADFPEPEHVSDHDPLRTLFAPCVMPAAPGDMTIVRGQGAAVSLTWPVVPNAATYQVWRDTSPYFTPSGQPAATVTEPAYSDPNATGDPATNYYYVVTPVNACGGASGLSNRVGEFDFALTPGQ